MWEMGTDCSSEQKKKSTALIQQEAVRHLPRAQKGLRGPWAEQLGEPLQQAEPGGSAPNFRIPSTGQRRAAGGIASEENKSNKAEQHRHFKSNGFLYIHM